MPKPRPSPNLGKFTSTRDAVASSPGTAPGSSVGSSLTTFSSGDGGVSLTARRPLISLAIDLFLEGRDADSLYDIDETLYLTVPALEVALDQAFDHVRQVGARERRTEDLAEGGGRLISADLDLVPLLAVLIDAEDADVADVVVAAGVHAAGDVEVELADVEHVVEVVEAALDRFRDRDRLSIGERAEVAARAGDDVGEQADVGRREAERARLAPEIDQAVLAHVGEDQVLLVRHAQLAEGVAVGEIGDRLHLVGGDVARRHAGLLQGQRYRGIAAHLVRMHVALQPRGEAGGAAEARQILALERVVVGPREALGDALDLLMGERRGAILEMRPFRLDFLAKALRAALLHQDLDACLVDVVAAAVAVIDPQDRLDVREQVRPRQELADDEPDHRRAAEAAADQHFEADVVLLVLDRMQADIV